MDNPPVVLSELPRSLAVSDAVRELVEVSVSANTRRAYRSALNKFGDHLAGAPVTDEAIADYLAALHEAGKSPQTCAQVVAAIRFVAKLHGQDPPIGPVTNGVLGGIRRSGRGRGRGQVKGVNWGQADAAATFAVTGGSLADTRDAAIIAVASDGMLRASEVAALEVSDITCQPDGSGTVIIRSSKTDQEGRGAELYLGATTVDRIKAWQEKAGIREGPLFRRVFLKGSRVGDRKMNVDSVRKIIKKRCAAIGIEGKVSGHSLRVGGAQSLAAGGASLPEMQTAGRWDSPQMPGHYARGQLAAKGAVARIKYSHGETIK